MGVLHSGLHTSEASTESSPALFRALTKHGKMKRRPPKSVLLRMLPTGEHLVIKLAGILSERKRRLFPLRVRAEHKKVSLLHLTSGDKGTRPPKAQFDPPVVRKITVAPITKKQGKLTSLNDLS